MKKCIVQKLEGCLNLKNPESADYLYGGVIKFSKNWADGKVVISSRPVVAYSEDDIIAVDCTYTLLDRNERIEITPNKEKDSYIIIKNTRGLFTNIYLGVNSKLPNRFCNIPSRIYYTANVENSGLITSTKYFNSPVVYGTILDIAKCISIEPFDLSAATNLVGSLDDFAKALMYFGRKEGQITVVCNGVFSYIINGEEVTPEQGASVVITFADGGYSLAPS